MATHEIKTRFRLEGEQEYKRAMSDAASAIKVLNSEQKLAKAEFEASGDAQEYAAESARILREQINEQKRAVEAAEKAMKQLGERTSDNAKKYDTWKQKMNNAKTSLIFYENQLKETQGEIAATNSDISSIKESADGVDKGINFQNTIAAIDNITDHIEKIIRGAARAAKALWDMGVDAGTWADNLITAASELGVDVETYQSWQYASRFIDTSVEDIKKSWQDLDKHLKADMSGDDFRTFSEKLVKIGVGTIDKTTRQVKQGKDAFWEIIDALHNMGSESAWAATAMDIFGNDWRRLNPLIEAGSKEFNKVAQEGRGIAVVSEKNVKALGAVDDKVQQLGAQFDALKYETIAALAPTFEQVADAMSKAMTALDEFVKSEEGQAALSNLNEALSGIITSFLGEDNGKGTFEAIVNGAAGAVEKFTGAMKWLETHGWVVMAVVGGLATAWTGLKVTKEVLQFAQLLSGAKSGASSVFGKLFGGKSASAEGLDSLTNSFQKTADSFGSAADAANKASEAASSAATAAKSSADAASSSAEGAGSSATASKSSETAAGSSATAAESSAASAGSSAEAAGSAAEAAGSSAEAAGEAATAAGNSSAAASGSADAASSSVTASEQAALSAGNAAKAAGNSSAAAAGSADAAGYSLTASEQAALSAGSAADAAGQSALAAGSAADAAGQSAIAAGDSATAALESGTAAGQSAIAAGGSADAARLSAGASEQAALTAGSAAEAAGYSAEASGQAALTAGNASAAASASADAALSSVAASEQAALASGNAALSAGNSSAAAAASADAAGLSVAASEQAALTAGYSTEAAQQMALSAGESATAAGGSAIAAGDSAAAANSSAEAALSSAEATRISVESAANSAAAAAESALGAASAQASLEAAVAGALDAAAGAAEARIRAEASAAAALKSAGVSYVKNGIATGKALLPAGGGAALPAGSGEAASSAGAAWNPSLGGGYVSAADAINGVLGLGAIVVGFEKAVEARRGDQEKLVDTAEHLAAATEGDEKLLDAFEKYVKTQEAMEKADYDYYARKVSPEEFNEIIDAANEASEAFLKMEGAGKILDAYNSWRAGNSISNMDWILPENWKDLARNAALGLEAGADESLEDIGQAGQNMGQALADGAADALDEHSPSKVFETIGGNAAVGLANGIYDRGEEAIRAAQWLADSVTAIMTEALQIHSPSKVFERLGEFTGLGFAGGIERSASAVDAAMSRLISGTSRSAVAGYGGLPFQMSAASSPAYGSSADDRSKVIHTTIMIDDEVLADVMYPLINAKIGAEISSTRR